MHYYMAQVNSRSNGFSRTAHYTIKAKDEYDAHRKLDDWLARVDNESRHDIMIIPAIGYDDEE